MALPLPKVVADVGPGGPLVTAMGGMNSLANNMLLRKINEVKAQYAPLTMQAEAASKLAYANLMAPQFLAKLLGNDAVVANMGDSAARSALDKVVRSGMGQGTGANIFSQMQQEGSPQLGSNPFMQMGQQFQSPGKRMGNQLANSLAQRIHNIFGGGSPVQNQMGQVIPQGQVPIKEPQVGDAVTSEAGSKDVDDAYDKWLASPQGRAEIAKGEKANIPSEDEIVKLMRRQEPSWAEKTGQLKGEVKQGEELGKHRAQALKEIGDSQLGLSNSGAVLDRMTNIIKNPVFQNMRSKIPFFQDRQLNYLMKNGTPEEKRLIGDFLTTAEQFIASTVQGFGGRPLVREFDLAKRQKITPSDPVHVAEGKLRAAISLKKIAEQKNDIIAGFLEKGMNLSNAVKRANKMIDVSAIEKQTDKLLRDKPSEEDVAYMAQKYKISPEEVRSRLKDRGLL